MGGSYQELVRVVSGLLYGYDPGGMGSTVFAPEDVVGVPRPPAVPEVVLGPGSEWVWFCPGGS